MNRRTFLRRTFAASGAAAFASLSLPGCSAFNRGGDKAGKPLYKISLAEWSLNDHLFGREGDGKMTNLDFPVVAKREFGIDAVEYVNQFFMDKARDTAYLDELKQRCEGEGVRSLLIMCDREGQLGDPDDAKRKTAVENHHKWVDAARHLGCYAIRVNAGSAGSYEEQQKLAADGLRRLTEYGAKQDIAVIVENHGGLSSNGEWLAGVMKIVDHPLCGTLPDFGNFAIDRQKNVWYDRYKGVDELMPYAKAVSAKAHDFGPDGNETQTDFYKMMKIVLDHGYRGHVGIEYEGKEIGEFEGIRKTKALLEKVRDHYAGQYKA